MSVPEYIAKYSDLEAGSQLTDVTVSLAGESSEGRLLCVCVCVSACA